MTVAGGTFNLYSGKICDNKAYNFSDGGYGGVFVCNQGTFNMSGGEITGNTTYLEGAGVFVGGLAGLHDAYKLSGGTFNMSGGTITGNKAGSSGGGVYVSGASNTSFKISGSAQITDNYTGNPLSSSYMDGTANNVYLEKYTGGGVTTTATINVEGTLTGNIGVTTEEVEQTVATGVSEAAAKCFTSDDSSNYRLIYNSGERTLTMATAAHSAHPVCGDVNCNEHAELTGWQGVDDLSKIDKEGNYYLTKNVTIDSTWNPLNGVVLCLNGYDITIDGVGYAIYLREGYTFTLCQCKGGGKITHTKGVNGRGVYVVGFFNMYGGSISGNSAQWGSGVCLDNGEKGTVFNMYGGEITGNTATSSGGGGVNVNTKSTFNMYGGSITDNLNTASGDYGGGVYVSQDGIFTVSGKVNITGNKYKDNTVSNVYLYSDKTIQIVGALDSTASIGVTTKNAVDLGKFVTVATGAKDSCTEGNFSADKGKPYGIKVEQGTDANSVNVNLYNGLPHVHYLCNGKDESGKDKCTGIGNHTEKGGAVTFEPWTRSDSLPEEEGNWYLTKDVEITKTWTKNNGVVLCLNGYSITLKTSGTTTDAVYAGTTAGATSTLTICDCNGSGNGN